MDITLFFTKKSKKSNPDKKEKNKDDYIRILSQLLSNKSIDMLEYSFLLNFSKVGGTLVNMGRFNKIYGRLTTKHYSTENVVIDTFKEVCSRKIPHILELSTFTKDGVDININKILEKIIDNNFEFTDDQKNGIINICNFLANTEMKTYGLYGYAGSGKTTLIIKLIGFLLKGNYINSVALTAPTNKALNVLKVKFSENVDDLFDWDSVDMEMYDKNGTSLDDKLKILETVKNQKITFMTIHRLLGFKNDYDKDGNNIFVKGKDGELDKYDFVIIDECSMISYELIVDIFEEIRKKIQLMSKDNIVKKVPKILFVGDPAQLPPVNEKKSIIFSQKEEDFDKKDDTDEYSFTNLKLGILGQKTMTLTKIVRSADNKVVGLCNEIRRWVIEDRAPIIGKFKGMKVILYKKPIGMKNTDSEWFKKSINYFSENKDLTSNIILAWTNKQCNEYNDVSRQLILGRSKEFQVEVGDLLILRNFYNIQESDEDDIFKNDKNNRFYTSEQIKVVSVEKIIKGYPTFTENLPGHLTKLKTFNYIQDKFVKTVRSINKNTGRKFEVFKLHIQKMSDVVIKDYIPETFKIYVLRNESYAKLKTEKDFVSERIKELRKYYFNFLKESIDTIDKYVIKPLWREWNRCFIDAFAQVDISYCITVHRSQGSSFYNVFVDAPDIFKNKNDDEAKRCMYTALTRTCNELHILL